MRSLSKTKAKAKLSEDCRDATWNQALASEMDAPQKDRSRILQANPLDACTAGGDFVASLGSASSGELQRHLAIAIAFMSKQEKLIEKLENNNNRLRSELQLRDGQIVEWRLKASELEAKLTQINPNMQDNIKQEYSGTLASASPRGEARKAQGRKNRSSTLQQGAFAVAWEKSDIEEPGCGSGEHRQYAYYLSGPDAGRDKERHPLSSTKTLRAGKHTKAKRRLDTSMSSTPAQSRAPETENFIPHVEIDLSNVRR